MPLEQQVTSLELSRRLKEIGVEQKSLFYWFHRKVPGDDRWFVEQNDGPNAWEPEYSAFTVAELGEMLPPTLAEPYDIEHGVYDEPRRYGIEAKTYKDGVEQLHHGVIDKNEANARAKMLIYLLEHKLITLK